MKEKRQYDETKEYKVNGENVFDKTKEILENKIFKDFPNKETIVSWVFEIRGLNSIFFNLIILMFSTFLGNKVEEDLKVMKEKGQYDETKEYKVNGENVFDITKEFLKNTMFKDFPNKETIVSLVFEIQGLNSIFFIVFYNTNFFILFCTF